MSSTLQGTKNTIEYKRRGRGGSRDVISGEGPGVGCKGGGVEEGEEEK